MKYNTIKTKCNAIQCNVLLLNDIEWYVNIFNGIQCNTMFYYYLCEIQFHAMKLNKMQCNAI